MKTIKRILAKISNTDIVIIYLILLAFQAIIYIIIYILFYILTSPKLCDML